MKRFLIVRKNKSSYDPAPKLFLFYSCNGIHMICYISVLGIQPMTFPQMPGYVVIPQNQLAQLQQLQEQALRQQLQQQQDQIKKYENETKQLLNKQQNQTNNQNNKNQKDRD